MNIMKQRAYIDIHFEDVKKLLGIPSEYKIIFVSSVRLPYGDDLGSMSIALDIPTKEYMPKSKQIDYIFIEEKQIKFRMIEK